MWPKIKRSSLRRLLDPTKGVCFLGKKEGGCVQPLAGTVVTVKCGTSDWLALGSVRLQSYVSHLSVARFRAVPHGTRGLYEVALSPREMLEVKASEIAVSPERISILRFHRGHEACTKWPSNPERCWR
jgi:hypothetical protein